MFFKCRICIFLVIFLEVAVHFSNSHIRRNNRKQYVSDELNGSAEGSSSDKYSPYNKILVGEKKCWMHINSKKHFQAMDKLEESYADVLKEYQVAAEKDKIDQQMLDVMANTRGAAEREIQKTGGDAGLIPAGINLGGYFMMRMPNSLLFFHRMKLRNNTHFRVTELRNDLVNLTLHAHLSLNDLHLQGSYDRSKTDKDPSILFYTPTYGQVEILLKNVQYAMEGRYRLLKDRLTIELIISNIDFDDVMMIYLNGAKSEGMRLQRKNIEDFLIRLNSDLDKWLKDYFNDYLMYFGIVGKNSNDKFQQYDKERAKELNGFTDKVIGSVTRRLQKLKAETVKLPKFTIYTANNMKVTLKDGVLRGLDSMYRRSIATGKKHKNIRKIDAVVGFSNLKVTYQYVALLASNTPVVTGLIILSADELTTRMQVTISNDTDTVDIQFEYMEQAKPESLTIEGAANRMISNFKYILEQHIIAIMSNTLHFNIKSLSSLTRCFPRLHPGLESNILIDEGEEGEGEEKDEHLTTKVPPIEAELIPESDTTSPAPEIVTVDPEEQIPDLLETSQSSNVIEAVLVNSEAEAENSDETNPSPDLPVIDEGDENK